ncbi:hypothetical protein ABBQ38_012472 [Trebouxia sp. C0009 RCD-2024]
MCASRAVYALAISGLILVADASPYDPHVPGAQPWFEGWYTRVIAVDSAVSFGTVAGLFPSQALAKPAYFAGIIVGNVTSRNTQVYQQLPPSITATASGGRPVHEQPTALAPPDFSLEAADFSYNLTVSNDDFRLSAYAAGVTLTLVGNAPNVPWGPGGETPEGALAYLPFADLHWYVYSLATPVTWTFHNPEASPQTLTGQGYAHMEKNWGRTFPEKWVWAQGMRMSRRCSSASVSEGPEVMFALAGGPAPLSRPWLVRAASALPMAWLVAYHSQNIKWNFRPYDPTVFRVHSDACHGLFQLNATRFLQSVVITIDADSDSFGDVACPTSSGFSNESMHSFAAEAHIQAYRYRLWPLRLLGWELVETQVIPNVALEFGGTFRC